MMFRLKKHSLIQSFQNKTLTLTVHTKMYLESYTNIVSFSWNFNPFTFEQVKSTIFFFLLSQLENIVAKNN